MPAEAGRDRGAQRVAVMAEPQHQSLRDRCRKIGRAQALAEDAGKDDLAVDENAVAIEDDQLGHAGSFPAPALTGRPIPL